MKKEMLTLSISILLLFISFSGCIEEIPPEESKNEETSPDESMTNFVVIDGKGNYTSIQNAIDNASDGDTIFVYNGIYYETLVINKPINLISASKDKTIIHGKNSNSIVLINADNCTINGFKIINTNSSSEVTGIMIKSSYNTISNNTVLNTAHGVYLSLESKNNTISMNTISNNDYGFYLTFSYSNHILTNNISLNSLYGIHLYPGSYNNVISGNNISENGYGIRLQDASSNTISGNVISNNQRGMYFCCQAQNNVIYYNTFKQNTEWNAHDKVNNQWDNGSIGNYWDDYDGIDADGDGIGDTPYDISDGSNQDRYPLMNPYQQ